MYISELQENTLILIDDMINKEQNHDDIMLNLLKQGYDFIKEIKNGYMSKTKTKLYKNGENSFVTLIKRRNSLADYESYILR